MLGYDSEAEEIKRELEYNALCANDVHENDQDDMLAKLLNCIRY